MQELQHKVSKERFGDYTEISAPDFIDQVNKAGDDVWVVLHLYKD